MFLTKTLKVFIFIVLWAFLFGSCQASEYGYFTYRDAGNQTVTINTPSDFDSWGTWNSIGNFLVTSHYKTYVLNWRGYGGRTDYGKAFIQYIQRAERQGKRIVIKMTGNSYSMHALVPCYATQVINNSNKFLMYHADGYSDYRTARNHSTITNQLNMCVSVGILTSGKLNKMWDGYEVYIDNHKTWYYRDPRSIG